jgi:PAS domain S-box-containing protein
MTREWRDPDRSFAMAAGGITVLTALAVLAGWQFDVPVLKSVAQGLPTMRPNTALAFLLAGAGLLATASRSRRPLVAAFAAGTLAIGLATTLQYLLGWNLGIDELLFKDLSPVQLQYPGRMSLLAAVTFLLVGVGLAAPLLGAAAVHVATACGVAVFCVGLVGVTVYAADSAFGLERWTLAATALHAMLLFCVLGAGLAALGVQVGRFRWVIDRYTTFALIGACALVVATLVFAFQAMARATGAQDAMARSLAVLRATEQVRGSLFEAHGAIRDLVLTGNRAHLMIARERLDAAEESLAGLRGLAADSITHEVRLDLLEPLVAERVAFARRTLAAVEARGIAAGKADAASGYAQDLMAAIRLHLDRLAEEESETLEGRQRAVHLAALLVALVVPAGAALSLLVIAGAFLATNREALRRLQREAELREANERMRFLGNIVEQTTQPFAAADLAGRFTRVNPAFERLTGYTRAELATKHINDLTPEKWHAMEHKLISEELIGRKRSIQFEKEYRRKDGSVVPIELVADAFLDPAGNIECLYAFVSDLSERRQMQDRLVAEQQRFRQLLDSVAEGIYGIDSQGNCGFVNPAALRLLGYAAPEDVIGRNMHALIHHARADRSPFPVDQCPIYRSFRDGSSVHSDDDVFWRADGQPVPVEYWASPVRTESGISGAVVAFMDIGERKRMLAELQGRTEALARSNADLEQFAYVASHDLQEPLRAVAGSVQLLKGAYGGKLDERADTYIRHAVEGVKRMQTLINDLLAFSRIGTRGAEFSTASLERALQRAREALQVAIREKSAAISHDPLPTVKGDEGQLTLLLQNLVGNALKFCRDGSPEIHVGAARDGAAWVVSVRDNGIGIDPQYFDRIFVIFQRLHTRTEYEGTGIGLALCKKIVERHGGRIWVESAPGRGSTFRFSIPEEAQST